jgi:hypothetical protein
MTTHRTIRSLAACTLLAACGLPALANDTLEAPQITREGEGPRRVALNKRERTPFAADAWDKLSNWTNGPALTSTATEGKVVLVVTWTDYLPTARRAVSAATRLAERHGKDGLIVVLVHDAKEWDNATKPKAPNDASPLLVAHDATGEFRKALDVDQDPDYYIIDRAGQLRFADITSEAVEAGVTMLLAEKVDAAANVNDRIKQANEDARKSAQRAAAANAKADMVQIPVLPFAKPSEAEYNKANWPPRPRDENVRDDPKAMVTLGEVKLPETGWFPRKPSLDGKVVFAYTWHPGVDISYSELAGFIDTMQRQYARDVVFVGVVTMYENLTGITLTKDDKDPEKVKERVAKFLEIRNYDHYIALGLENNIHAAALSTAGGASGMSIVPGVVILSSDGKTRYATFPPDKRNIFYRAALDAIVANDPGVKARRKAEDDWLKAQKKNGEGQ